MLNIDLGKIKCIGTSQNRIDGLVLKRKVTIREAKYILANILGIVLQTKDDFEDLEEYQERNQEYTETVTKVTPSGKSVGIYQFSSDNIDFLIYYKVCSQSEWDSAIDRLNVWLKDANLKVKKL